MIDSSINFVGWPQYAVWLRRLSVRLCVSVLIVTAVKLYSEAVCTLAVSEEGHYWKTLIRERTKVRPDRQQREAISRVQLFFTLRGMVYVGPLERVLVGDGNLSNQNCHAPRTTLR